MPGGFGNQSGGGFGTYSRTVRLHVPLHHDNTFSASTRTSYSGSDNLAQYSMAYFDPTAYTIEHAYLSGHVALSTTAGTAGDLALYYHTYNVEAGVITAGTLIGTISGTAPFNNYITAVVVSGDLVSSLPTGASVLAVTSKIRATPGTVYIGAVQLILDVKV